jgi:hypothetical protein
MGVLIVTSYLVVGLKSYKDLVKREPDEEVKEKNDEELGQGDCPESPAPESDQGDNGQCPGRWSSVDETREVDGQLNDDQAAHELCKTCTEKIDSAEPQRGTFLIVFLKN